MQERRVAGFYDKRHAGLKCIGWVVVGDAQPVEDALACGCTYSSSVLIAGRPLLQNVNVHLFGAEGRSRTRNLIIRSDVLLSIELLPRSGVPLHSVVLPLHFKTLKKNDLANP